MSGTADAPPQTCSRGGADAFGSFAEAPATLAHTHTTDADASMEAPRAPLSSPWGGLAPVLSRALSRAEEDALSEAKEGNFVRCWDDYELTPGMPRLGDGSFGEVWCVRRKSCPDVLYALKQPKDRITGLAQIAAEYGVLRRLHHLAQAWLPECAIDSAATEPIVRVHGVFLEGPRLGLLLQYHGISLAKALEARALNEAARERVACNVASAGRYMHKHNVVHRDLKCANVLVNPADGFRAKVRARCYRARASHMCVPRGTLVCSDPRARYAHRSRTLAPATKRSWPA
jgi:hypothetical protein